MARNYKNKYSYGAKKRFDWQQLFRLLPVYLTVGFLPFLIRVHMYDPNLSRFSWYYSNVGEVFGDTYLVYRQWWFTGISFYMLLVLLFKMISDKKSLRYSLTCIPMGVFAVFSLLSAIFSDYKEYAFGGGFEQFENVFVLMGYALIVYYIFLMVESEAEVKNILGVLTFSTMALGMIGTLQTFGYDVIHSEFVKRLIVPAKLGVELQSKSKESTAVMTLYNPNYVGVYVAMLFPLYAALTIFVKNWKERIVYAVTLLLLLISLYGSGSKAAFLVIACEMLIFLVFLRRPILKFWYLMIPSATALVCVFLLVNQARDNVYIDRIQSALRLHKTEYALEAIETRDDGVYILYEGNELVITFEQKSEESFLFNFIDADHQKVAAVLKEDGITYRLDDTRFEGFEVGVMPYPYEGNVCFEVLIEGHVWRFTNQYDSSGSYYYLTERGKYDKIVMAEQVVFQDYERILSGRGYIWSVSIPLLKKHIILGSGADNFLMAFPHQDYLRLWRIGTAEKLMSKPHSLYLQVGVQDGVIALVGLLAFFGIYLVQSVKLYLNSKFESFHEQVGVAVMLAVIGFAVMGISNDSSVTVSPIFWAIAGVGVYVNGCLANNKKTRKSATE